MNELLTPNQLAWVRELVLGDRKQGIGSLVFEHDGVRRYCCLGVLGELLAPHVPELLLDGGTSAGYLTDATSMELVGLTRHQQETFGILNDNERWTFPEIAGAVVAHFYNGTPTLELTQPDYSGRWGRVAARELAERYLAGIGFTSLRVA